MQVTLINKLNFIILLIPVVPIESNRGKESKVPEFCNELPSAVSDAALAPEFASPGSTASTSGGNWSRMRHMSGISVNNDDDVITCSPAVDKLTPSLSDLASNADAVSSGQTAQPPPPNPWQIPPQSAGAVCDSERSRQWVQKQQGESLKRSDSGGYFMRTDEVGFNPDDLCPPPTPLYDTMYKYPEIPPCKNVSDQQQRCQINSNGAIPGGDQRRHSWYEGGVLDSQQCRKAPMSMKTECEPPRLSHYPTPYPQSACDDKIQQHHSEGSTPSHHRPTFLPLHLSESSDYYGSSSIQSPYTPAFLTPSPAFPTPGSQYRRDDVFNFRSPGPPFRKSSEGKMFLR